MCGSIIGFTQQIDVENDFHITFNNLSIYLIRFIIYRRSWYFTHGVGKLTVVHLKLESQYIFLTNNFSNKNLIPAFFYIKRRIVSHNQFQIFTTTRINTYPIKRNLLNNDSVKEEVKGGGTTPLKSQHPCLTLYTAGNVLQNFNKNIIGCKYKCQLD